MNIFRALLGIIFISIACYTAVTVSNHGLNLIPVFFGDMLKMAWPGQFNFDFFCFLIISGTWVAWRHQFSPPGLVLGLIAVFGGAFFLSAYLFITSFKVNGDIPALLLGNSRAQQLRANK